MKASKFTSAVHSHVVNQGILGLSTFTFLTHVANMNFSNINADARRRAAKHVVLQFAEMSALPSSIRLVPHFGASEAAQR